MIELTSRNLIAHVMPMGATLSGLWLNGHPSSLVLGSSNCEDYRKHLTYFGSIVGPVANRLGTARVVIEGQVWQLEANEPEVCLHGGASGLHAQVWKTKSKTAQKVTLSCHVPHGAGGLPGNRQFEATYELNDEGVLSLELCATSDTATLINLAHHPYWNLDGNPSVQHHELQVLAQEYLAVDDGLLPTGEIRNVAGTPYDFRAATKVPTHTSLDANLCLAISRRARAELAAILSAPSGVSLRIETTEPGLQVYNAHELAVSDHKLHDGQSLGPCAGLALEPQCWPDAPRNPGFPSILVPAHTVYRQITRYHISKQ